MVTRCAWYRAEQWDHLLEISTDRDELEDTYEEWVSNAEESLRNMRKAGIYAEKVDVDVEALVGAENPIRRLGAQSEGVNRWRAASTTKLRV